MTPRFLVPFRSSRQLSDPFGDLHREMNRLFDDFVGTGASGGSASQGGGLMAVPRLDVRESQDEIRVCVELPGVQPSDVDLRIEGNVLTIAGEKKSESDQSQHDYHVMERSFGKFQRSLQLPFEPDPDQVRAGFEHGVLTVRVPKQLQQEKSRRIEIQAGSASTTAKPQTPVAERVDNEKRTQGDTQH